MLGSGKARPPRFGVPSSWNSQLVPVAPASVCPCISEIPHRRTSSLPSASFLSLSNRTAMIPRGGGGGGAERSSVDRSVGRSFEGKRPRKRTSNVSSRCWSDRWASGRLVAQAKSSQVAIRLISSPPTDRATERRDATQPGNSPRLAAAATTNCPPHGPAVVSISNPAASPMRFSHFWPACDCVDAACSVGTEVDLKKSTG